LSVWWRCSPSPPRPRRRRRPQRKSPETLKAEIEDLRPAKIAWREIQWKTCLLEGLKESREKKKPVLLWIVGPGEALDGRTCVCAGAAREAVFSNPDVVRRINADFVPVAITMLSIRHGRGACHPG
jgi:hypothetical protein